MVEEYKQVESRFSSYLNDESSIVEDSAADTIYFPRTEQELASIIDLANNSEVSVTISGGGTGLSGGRVPQGGWIIATDKMKSITNESAEQWKDPETSIDYQLNLQQINQDQAILTVPIAMTVKAVQNYCREQGWFYPPDPTERSSFIGGNVATNASGARTFKFGPTRKWIEGFHVILPDGKILKLTRSKSHGKLKKTTIRLLSDEIDLEIPRPNYQLPDVSKNVTGPVITDVSDPMDIFIGTNGIFGVITQVTLKLIRPPSDIVSIFVFSDSIKKALKIIRSCQEIRKQENFPVPMSVEYLDHKAIEIMRIKDNQVPENARALIMLEQDVKDKNQLDHALEFWNYLFDQLEISNVFVAQTHNEIEHHKMLRHYVPEYIIEQSRKYGQKLVVTDNSVPNSKFQEFFNYLIDKGEEFMKEINENDKLVDDIGYSLFGHAGNSHLHLSLLPRDHEESELANKYLVEILHKVISLGGAIAAEHGLGKKRFEKKPALAIQYGDTGLKIVTKMKESIDPKWILCPGNLIDPQ